MSAPGPRTSVEKDVGGHSVRTYEQARTPDREPSDQGDEKRGWLVDPFGHRWAIHSPIR